MNQKDINELAILIKKDIFGFIASPEHYRFFVNNVACLFKMNEEERRQFFRDCGVEAQEKENAENR